MEAEDPAKNTSQLVSLADEERVKEILVAPVFRCRTH